MPACPRCGQQWPDGYQSCPNDGTALSSYPVTAIATSTNAAPALAPQGDEDLPAGSAAGEYRIEKKIGEGGMGSVYGARHPVIGKRAAIKVIRRELSTSREAVDRFVLEAQSVNQIGHPNIVDVFGFGQLSDGRSFFVMEWLEGESLRERLQRPLPFPEAIEILEQITKALQAAHEAGVVHRDLKPDNVYLHARRGDQPSVKLLDFGLAKLTSQNDAGRFNQTRTGIVMGTPLYLSPEQAKGAKIDAATDVYSLGAMAYEMFSGVVPFKADSAVEIMAMHISERATPLTARAPWVPAEVNSLVLAMLEKAARNRPTASQVREAFGAIRASAKVAATPTIGMAIAPGSQPGGGWTPQAYTPQLGVATPQMRGGGPGTPPAGVPYPAPASQSAPHPYQTPSSPQASPYPQQPTPSTPQVSPYAQPTPSTPQLSPYGQPTPSTPQLSPYAAPRGKRALLIGGVAVLALGIGGFVIVGKQKAASKKPEVAANEPSGSAVTPTPTEETQPATGSATSPGETQQGSASTQPDPTKPDPTKPDSTDSTKPDPTKPDSTKPDPTKPDPAKTQGRVNVMFSGPPRGMIFIDGKAMGRETGGKASFSLAPGEHTVRIQAKGYKPTEQKFRIAAGSSENVRLTLEKRRSVNSVEDPFAD